MRIGALACDYDGTLATDGRVDDDTIAALERFVASGRRLLLVTGRQRPDLERIFPRLDLFDRVVAENGALLFDPRPRRAGDPGGARVLAARPPDAFVATLRARGVDDLSVGEVIVATRTPHDAVAKEAIAAMKLPLEVIYNKGNVMILPRGVDKRTGLAAALAELHVPLDACVGVGDAENDAPFLRACGRGVATANALPALKDEVDLVTRGDHGRGVAELADRIVADDLAGVPRKPRRGGPGGGERMREV